MDQGGFDIEELLRMIKDKEDANSPFAASDMIATIGDDSYDYARGGYADGGETDPMLDDDISKALRIAQNPYEGQIVKPYEGSWRDKISTAFQEAVPEYSATPGGQRMTQFLTGGLGIGATNPSVLDFVPVVGQGIGAQEALHEGDYKGAAMAIIPGVPAYRAEQKALQLAARELSPSGLYSHGSEVAANLPQAKGKADQMIGTLRNLPGVRAEELENAGLIDAAGNIHPEWAGKPVTREELATHLQQSMPQVEETLLSSKANKYPYRDADEWQDAINRAERRRDFDEAQRLTLAWEEAEGIGQAGSPKFQQYTLPGGENYREVLLKYPNPAEKLDQRRREIERLGLNATPEQKQEWADIMNKIRPNEQDIEGAQRYSKMPDFKSKHWPDDPNVLAHLRMSDRVGPNGEKLLHVEEIQSDWAQKGRKEGFYNPEEEAQRIKNLDVAQKQFKDLKDELYNQYEQHLINEYNQSPSIARVRTVQQSPAAIAQIFDREQEYQALSNAANPFYTGSQIPTAPYVTNTQGWTDLALKRALKEAAEGGYEGIVFTPGAEQAKRYDLSKQVSSITYNSPDSKLANKYGTVLKAFDKNGNEVINKLVAPEKLPEYVGKEVAQKLLEQQADKFGKLELAGQDLSVGGSGMKGYYDKIVPTQLQKLIKGLDKEAKLGKIQTNSLPEMLHLPITEKMRQEILAGQKAFAAGGAIDHALRLAREKND